ncbi:MAG: GNAT family N-acetyltransferase [Angelakisella sp.]
MLTYAEPNMIPDLTALWQCCFGDSEDYISFFMTRRFQPEGTVVWLEGGRAVGAIYLLPCKIGIQEARYCYAVGVSPEYRGRGICAAMLAAAETWCVSRQMPLFCAPRAGMADYYRQRGYQDAFFCRWVEFSPTGHADELAPTEVESAQYMRLRNQALPQQGLVRWDEPAVEYALAEHRLCGGFAHLLSWQGEDYLLLGQQEARGLVLTETTLPEGLLAKLAPSLCASYGGNRLFCRLPSPQGGEMTGVCFGSVTWSSGWLGLEII